MRRLFTMCIASLMLATASPASAIGLQTLSPTNLPGPHWRAVQCRYQRLDGRPGYTKFEVAAQIACAVHHWPVAGGFATALCYASHESGLDPYAANPYSSAKGVFQTVDGTWDHIWSTQPAIRHRWHLSIHGPGRNGVFNARTVTVLVIRRVAGVGWSSWSRFASYSC